MRAAAQTYACNFAFSVFVSHDDILNLYMQ
jgi:hypothetical protein